MEQKANDHRSIWMMVCSMLIFGTIGVFRRFIPLPSAFLACTRGIIGGLCILLLVRLKGKRNTEKPARRDLLILVVSGAMIGANWMLLFEAYNHTTVAIATLCYYMAPTIVILLSPIIFRERMTVKKAVCAAVAIAGMVLVSGVAGGGENEVSIPGILLGLGAAVLYALIVILNKKIPGIDAYRKTSIQLLSAGLAMVPYLLLTGGFQAEGFSLSAAALVLVVGIVHTGTAYTLYFGSMDGLRVQTVAILSYIDPVSALLFSAFLLREPLTPLNILGAVMIIGSAMASEIRKAEPPAPQDLPEP